MGLARANLSLCLATEEYFHCKDLGTELAPVIKRFQSKEAELLGSSVAPLPDPPIVANPNAPDFAAPFAFVPWINHHVARGPGEYTLFQGKEKTVRLVVGSMAEVLAPVEGLLWQWSGHATVHTAAREASLGPGDMLLVAANEHPVRVTQTGATIAIQNLALAR